MGKAHLFFLQPLLIPVHPIVHKIVRLSTDRQLLARGDAIIAGISGGADSTALLHILASSGLDLRLTAVYIDHGLRPGETDAELAFTKKLAESLGATYLASRVEVRAYQREQGYSLEEAARILRYRELENIRAAHDARAIAVGHTADDQVEELLLRLTRGTGLKGLSGMAAMHRRIIRPLLTESKTSLLAYLAEHRLPFCHDSSNDDRRFLRNRIRLDLLPELEKRYNPAIRTTLVQTADILAREDALLDELTGKLFSDICSVVPQAKAKPGPAEILCRRDGLRQAHPALQLRVLEKICWQMDSRPTYRQLMQLQRLACDGESGGRLHLSQGLRARISTESVIFSHPLGKMRVRGEQVQPSPVPRLIASPGVYRFPEIRRQLDIHLNAGNSVTDLPAGVLAVDGDRAGLPLQVRPPRPGETMRLLGGPGRKKISRIMTDLKIPAEKRLQYPLILAGEEPVAILGLRIAEAFKLTERSRSILLLCWEYLEEV